MRVEKQDLEDNGSLDNPGFILVYYQGPNTPEELAQVREEATQLTMAVLTDEQVVAIDRYISQGNVPGSKLVLELTDPAGIVATGEARVKLEGDSVVEIYEAIGLNAELVYPRRLGIPTRALEARYPGALATVEFGTGSAIGN